VTKPAIVVVDDDDRSRSVLARELRGRYDADYSIVVEDSVDDALRRLQGLASTDCDVALILADHQMGGARLLAAARGIHPHAKRGLLLEWGENRAAREEIVRVLGMGHADYFLGKPMESPDERFHRGITEFLDEWWRVRGTPFEAVRVVGEERSARSHEICDLLQRHDFSHGFYTSDSDAGRAALEEVGVSTERLPVVITRDGRALVDPTNVEVADALGARTRAGTGVYDLVVLGAGPAGLGVAVNAGSEGLRTAMVEPVAMGGQAGTSSMIRNYLGFPRGISGAELAARAFDQAILFGTEMIYGSSAASLRVDNGLLAVRLSDGSEVATRTVVIATGVSYRMLDVAALAPYNGVGVFYGAAMSEARSLAGEQVYVVGGGNSAGQAAMYLAKFAARVTILVRSASLAHSMSEYLLKDIDATPNIDVRHRVVVVDAGGEGQLEWLALKDRDSEKIEKRAAAAIFVLIGAQPCTDWLPPEIERDEWGYLLTGAQCGSGLCRTSDNGCHVIQNDATAPTSRIPLLFETSMPGVFAVGDVRRGSVKRVASAAGDGAICVRLIHEYLTSV
jgi:thioredoxin reductase (NADPH)